MLVRSVFQLEMRLEKWSVAEKKGSASVHIGEEEESSDDE
jgi:hypothetical protein